MNWNDLARDVHQTAVENGLWYNLWTFDDIICECLVHLGRAYEEHRSGRPNLYYPCNAGGVCEADKTEGAMDCASRIISPEHPEIYCTAKSKTPHGAAAELGKCVLRVLDYEIVAVSKALIFDGFTTVDKSFSKTILSCVEYLCKSEAARGLGFRCATLSQVAEIILAWAKQEGLDMESILGELHECEKARAGRSEGATL